MITFAPQRVILNTLLALLLIAGASVAAQAMVSVPSGNRNAVQPRIPQASASRTRASHSSYDRKFNKILGVLRRDKRLMKNIRNVSKLYGIDPVHILGAIIGEHTYNYDSLDSAQSYYMKAVEYSGIRVKFAYDGELVSRFVKRPRFARCTAKQSSSDLWRCYETVWNTQYLGRPVDGTSYPNKLFHQVFFRPLFAGQSFGIGQLTPLTALKMSDLVHKVSGFPKLSPDNPMAVYKTVMDPSKSLHYTAAVLVDAINAYKRVAGVDISSNPGITSTLYNLGNPWERAHSYKARKRSSPRLWPSENYYGWLINDRLDQIRALIK
ncbi:DUF1402 family protein [Flexibacterium corallicola]|uniref:DUF1402 family protein n=1 Tax=Flexibacterium corallicola TaxID=3037259 RepID=UPI00286F357C|nr:DUF1402 family protein [Pseudovibrio sp. M1P-2-3]